MLDINDVIKIKNNIRGDIKVGDIGTVVHIFDVTSSVYEIEFIDDQGRTLEMIPLKEEDMSLYWIASTGGYVDEE